MVNEITIQVKTSPSKKVISLPLVLKVYKKREDFVYVWRSVNSDVFLEIVQTEPNYIFTDNINKDLQIITSKEIIAEQMMEKIPVF
jgi:hypothetical protein